MITPIKKLNINQITDSDNISTSNNLIYDLINKSKTGNKSKINQTRLVPNAQDRMNEKEIQFLIKTSICIEEELKKRNFLEEEVRKQEELKEITKRNNDEKEKNDEIDLELKGKGGGVNKKEYEALLKENFYLKYKLKQMEIFNLNALELSRIQFT
jgi:hypothetical protein